MYRKGRVFDKNVYNSVHGQKRKVIAYNKKIAEQVVIHNLLKLRFFIIFVQKEKKKVAEANAWQPSEPRQYVSKKQAARKLDSQFNGYHVKKSPQAAQNRPGDIPPPCLFGPDVDFLTREEIDDIKK